MSAKFLIVFASSSLLGVFVTACGSDEPAPPKDPTPVVHATCSAPAGGPEGVEIGAVEGRGGYDAWVDRVDLSSLPEELSLATTGEAERAYVAYALETTKPKLDTTLDRDEILARGDIGRAVLAAFSLDDGASLDFGAFRRGLHRFYNCDRAPPLTLEDFRSEVLDYKQLPPAIVESFPKCGPRRLYEDHEAGIYVGETLDGDDVRETEIIVEGWRNDGQLDFFVYDENGALMDRSMFPAMGGGEVVAAVPFGCMGCHSTQSGRVNIVFPDMAAMQEMHCRNHSGD